MGLQKTMPFAEDEVEVAGGPLAVQDLGMQRSTTRGICGPVVEHELHKL